MCCSKVRCDITNYICKCTQIGNCFLRNHIMNFSLRHTKHFIKRIITHTSAPIRYTAQKPQLVTDVMHRGACIRTPRHLSQHWSRWRHLLQSISQLIGTKRLAFMLYSDIYERLKACACVGVYCMYVYMHVHMHTLAADAHPSSLKGIRLMCLLTPHLLHSLPPALPPSPPLVPSPLPQSIHPSIHHLPLKAC